MISKMKLDIADIITSKVKLKKQEVINLLEKPPEGIKSDLAFPCFALAKKFKKDPIAIAIEISQAKPKGMIEFIEANGPYVNFHFKWNKLGKDVIGAIIREKNRYGKGKETGSVLIEHTSANPDGPLHLGHFRNTVIGDSLARIIRFSGKRVKTDFYVNDTGKQISLAAWYYLNMKTKPKGKLDWWVYDMYFKCNQRLEKYPSINNEVTDMILKFEAGNAKLRKTYDLIVDRCMKGHKETLDKLGIKVDNFVRESKFLFNGSVKSSLNKILKTNHGKKDGKRIWVDLKKFGIEREFVLTRSDGTTIYPARDIAYHLDKFSRADRNINVIGTDQKFYFKQLNSTLEYLNPAKAKDYTVLFYEFLLLPEGTMSTRLGKFVSVDEVIEKFVDSVKNVLKERDYSKTFKEKIANIIGIGALKYAMLKVSPEKTYSFSVEDSLNFEGNTAPYIQYTHARACSILKKVKISRSVDYSLLKERVEVDLVKKLMEFPEAAKKAADLMRPHIITNYAHELATMFNTFYHYQPVIKAEPKIRDLRLALVNATTIVLKSSLDLLGIEAPEKM